MRRRTVRAAVEAIADVLPTDEEMGRSIMASARENVEVNLKQLAEQQELAAEAEARKAGGWKSRTFAKTVESWQARTDEAIELHDAEAVRLGYPKWGAEPAS